MHTTNEAKTAAALAILYTFRMLGLFMVAPVLVVYGAIYSGATPELLGLALGVSGFTQALLLIPMGLLSDKFGRKKVIALGFILFAIGSLVAALSTSIEGLIIGRGLQGAGAVGGAILALVADLICEQNRSKAMAAVGASIGLSFMLAMIMGPIVAGIGGLAAIFGLALALALIAVGVLYALVPQPRQTVNDTRTLPTLFRSLLVNRNLAKLNFGIFALHVIFTGSFMVLPSMLQSILNLPVARHWVVYIPVLLLAFIMMLPLMMAAEKRNWIKPMFLTAVAALAVAVAGLGFVGDNAVALLLLVFVFFLAFNLLEASLPSLISKLAPVGAKGTVMGIFTTSQSLGIFAGGLGGGILLHKFGQQGVWLGELAIVAIWFFFILFMSAPQKWVNHRIVVPNGVGTVFMEKINLAAVNGVEQVHFVQEESALYLKVDQSRLDDAAFARLIDSLRS